MINESWHEVAEFEDLDGGYIFSIIGAIQNELTQNHGFSPEYVNEKLDTLTNHFNRTVANYSKRKGLINE